MSSSESFEFTTDIPVSKLPEISWENDGKFAPGSHWSLKPASNNTIHVFQSQNGNLHILLQSEVNSVLSSLFFDHRLTSFFPQEVFPKTGGAWPFLGSGEGIGRLGRSRKTIQFKFGQNPFWGDPGYEEAVNALRAQGHDLPMRWFDFSRLADEGYSILVPVSAEKKTIHLLGDWLASNDDFIIDGMTRVGQGYAKLYTRAEDRAIRERDITRLYEQERKYEYSWGKVTGAWLAFLTVGGICAATYLLDKKTSK